MRKINLPINLKTVVLFAIILLAYSCKPNEPVIAAKPVVTLQSADSVTYTSAVMVASVVPNGDASVSFQYKAASDVNWTICIASSKYSGTKAVRVSRSLSNLQPGITYTYKVTAVNDAGSVTPDQIVSFTTSSYTKAIAVIKPVINLKINSVTLVAIVTPNQPVSVVSFEFKPSANTDWQTQSLTNTYSGSDSTQVSLELSSLLANTSYDYRIKVSNKAGEVTSGVNSFKTYAVNDYDGNYYHTVTIGAQTWLQENLKTTHYANGDQIPNVNDPEAWQFLKTGAYIRYNNDKKLSDIYGLLYNWYVAGDTRELIKGWHVPVSNVDWDNLENYLGGDYAAAGVKMVGLSSGLWKNPLVSQVLTPYINSSGFTALPNGAFYEDGNIHKYVFMDLNSTATFWSSDLFMGYGCPIIIESSNCFFGSGGLYNKEYGFGLRLVKNN